MRGVKGMALFFLLIIEGRGTSSSISPKGEKRVVSHEENISHNQKTQSEPNGNRW